MSRQAIGTATRTPSPEEQYQGIAFTVPYDATDYNVTFEDAEMDMLLDAGLKKMLGNRAVSGFDFIVKLDGGNPPLFVGACSIDTASRGSGLHDVAMGVSVVTQSAVHEHRGILQASRRIWDGVWSLSDYIIQPPLRYEGEDPEDVVPKPEKNRKFASRIVRLAQDFDGTISKLPPEMRQKYVDERKESRARRARNDIGGLRGRW